MKGSKHCCEAQRDELLADLYLSNSESSDFEIAAASLFDRIGLPLSGMVGCSFVPPPLRRRSVVTGPTAAVERRENVKESHRRIACRLPPERPMKPASD